MTTFEFEGELRPDRTVVVPEYVAHQLPVGQPFRVVIPLAESDNDGREWQRMAAAEFAKAYAESDAIYDLPQGE